MSRFAPPAGPPRALALAQLINSLGDGAFYACSALFFTRIVGLSATRVGIALTVGWAIGMLAGVPLGHLADRFGPRRVAVLLAGTTAATLGAFLVVRSFPLFLLVVCGYAGCQGGLTSARQALLAGLVAPGERTRVRAYLQSTLNAGLAVGAGLGGLALYVDSPPAYLAVFAMDAASFLVAAAVLRRLPEVPPAPVGRAGEPRLAVLRDRPFALLTLLNAIMYLNMPLLSLVLPLWIVTHTDAPKPMAAALLLVNMLSVVLFQVRLARRVTDLRTAARVSARAGALMLAACAVYAGSSGHLGPWAAVAVLLLAAAIQVAGEMMQGAAAWELGFTLAPADKQGQYQGFFGMAPQIARMLGPAVLTTLLISWGTPGWFVLGGLFLGAGLAVGPVTRYAERTRATAQPVTAAT
ncbi:MAG TPA: MFS transporter [Actinophytocola sp.]|uniref:MFS transporter n=1 Tax=Actinophytocola sp. TaxID=1872138 RepID=UPI002DDDBC8E|nr:MFS transporter [Actinophytocola sp.]HEV2783917.1 MFS transporter [Actinophytocola sp.]